MTKPASAFLPCGISAAAAAAFLLFAGSAGAQQPSRAEALFRDARKMMEAKDYGSACPLFAESQKLEPAAGTLLNLADCYEKNGQTASAWTTFQEASKAAAARNKPEWVTTANARVAALHPKLATLGVSVAAATASLNGLRVVRDGTVLEKSAWGVEQPVDPGPHVIAATAPGRKAWTVRIDVPPGKKIVAEVPTLEAEAPGAGLPDEQRLLLEAGVKPKEDDDKNRDSKGGLGTLQIVGIAVGAVGVVGLGVGAFTGLHALGLRSDAAAKCDSYPTRCSPDASKANDDAKSFATISTISLVAGGVLAGAGIALVVIGPSSSEKKTTTRSGMRIVPLGLSGVAINATF